MVVNFFQTLLCKGTKSILHLLWWHKSPMKSLRKEFQQQSGVKLDHEPKIRISNDLQKFQIMLKEMA